MRKFYGSFFKNPVVHYGRQKSRRILKVFIQTSWRISTKSKLGNLRNHSSKKYFRAYFVMKEIFIDLQKFFNKGCAKIKGIDNVPEKDLLSQTALLQTSGANLVEKVSKKSEKVQESAFNFAQNGKTGQSCHVISAERQYRNQRIITRPFNRSQVHEALL